ncbi:ADP-ribosylglycohydrolase family protein [Pseudonocardia spinosispora]|uniref:ADP-ribosylglycohydrolase family protein n=1 Tax=Pseudonocardia spinosispora TaxID=103441 RepID=UPI0004022D9D|nr:ADP-ribosylglycohydrolase family protein [Pseudonocardia spinosispora]
MDQLSPPELALFRSRIRGCLLGGAIGDALGNPVEFLSLERIRASYGPTGITGLVPDGDGVIGRVTDDTQMPLFTAEGYRNAHVRARTEGIWGAETQLVREAYLRWLETQQQPGPRPAAGVGHRTGWLRDEDWLYAQRAPGNACLSGLRVVHVPNPQHAIDGSPGPVNPESKGCGTVMRSAPFGFPDQGPERAFVTAAHCAQITHGHPTGYYAAGALAAMTYFLVRGEPLPAALTRTLELLARHAGHEETTSALRSAADLAADGPASPEKVETLGGGWVAEEALAIAVYAALAGTTISAALLASVNHSGDSDSTGSICGNILGALHGDADLPHHWLAQVEGRAVIATVADDFAAEIHPGASGHAS